MGMYGATHGSEAEVIRQKWGWFLALGIVLAILGVLAMIFTVATTVVSVILLGVLILIGGVAVFASAFVAGSIGGGLLRAAGGILLVLSGVYLMFNPAKGAIALTLVMAWFFIITGVVQIVASLVEHYDGWGWTLAAGIVTLLLGILLSASWPVSGVFAIGLFIGIELLLSGFSWIIVAFTAHSYAPPAALPAA